MTNIQKFSYLFNYVFIQEILIDNGHINKKKNFDRIHLLTFNNFTFPSDLSNFYDKKNVIDL